MEEKTSEGIRKVKLKCIFGPVASRRLGKSLGIDLIPYKTCSFDCIYCELGKTTNISIEQKKYVSPDIILNNLKLFLDSLPVAPDYITLGGSGEPTLNSLLGNIIKDIKKLTSIPLAVLTNGSLLFLDHIKKSLLEADLVVPSLDAVTNSIFQYINRPHPSLNIEEIIQGIIDFRKIFKGEIWLEVLFCRGVNDTDSEVNKLREAIDRINPDRIQLNTVDRPPAEEFSHGVTAEQMEIIKDGIGEKAEVITEFFGTNPPPSSPVDEKNILNLLERRPCSLEEISRALGIHQNDLIKKIAYLRQKGDVQYRIHNRKGFYQVR